MKKQFKTKECENIMEKVLELHDETCVNMYQPIKEPRILIVEVTSSTGLEINQLQQMNLIVSVFADNYRLQMYLTKI